MSRKLRAKENRHRPAHPVLAPAQKLHWKPGTLLMPLPVVLVTTIDQDGKPNIVTVAWAGTVCSDPPMLSISLRPTRYSHPLICRTGEFVVNIPSTAQAYATDKCGVLSGRDVDKFAMMHLTPGPAEAVRPPIIMECRARKTMELGSHTLFIAEVVAMQVSAHLVAKGGRLQIEKANLLAFAHGHYHALGKHLGNFGFSVRRRRKL